MIQDVELLLAAFDDPGLNEGVLHGATSVSCEPCLAIHPDDW